MLKKWRWSLIITQKSRNQNVCIFIENCKKILFFCFFIKKNNFLKFFEENGISKETLNSLKKFVYVLPDDSLKFLGLVEIFLNFNIWFDKAYEIQVLVLQFV